MHILRALLPSVPQKKKIRFIFQQKPVRYTPVCLVLRLGNVIRKKIVRPLSDSIS